MDSTSINLLSISYDTLDTHLSQLIYIYLDYKLYNTYTKFDNTTVISSNINILENCYEMYICETLFNMVSVNTVTFGA